MRAKKKTRALYLPFRPRAASEHLMGEWRRGVHLELDRSTRCSVIAHPKRISRSEYSPQSCLRGRHLWGGGETLAINSHMDSKVLLQVDVARLADGRLLVVKFHHAKPCEPCIPVLHGNRRLRRSRRGGVGGARLNPGGERRVTCCMCIRRRPFFASFDGHTIQNVNLIILDAAPILGVAIISSPSIRRR